MTFLANLIFGIYLVCLSYITLYCLFQFHLLMHYTWGKFRNRKSLAEHNSGLSQYPFVTVQLPIFNEYYVVERLIDNICQLNYPRDKYEVHILDDSTDETLELSRKKVAEYEALGFNIKLLHRENRQGYKAGALRDGMKEAKGDFIAIFDADFLPDPEFLNQTLSYFENEKVGVVQTRWGHINQNYSLLTELQAFQLNVHFTIEQQGRESADYLLQFNGTAGVWRRTTIEDAGGWEADTLTEDLDLSYRAQLKNWQIIYLEDITSPAELPSEMHGLKSQQYRWMKGGAETARKLLPKVWKSDLGLMQKIHASSHLLASSVFVFVFILGVFSVPLLFLLNPMKLDTDLMSSFLISLIAIMSVYYVANVEAAWDNKNKFKSIIKFILIFPAFLALSMGLSLHNSVAVIQGFLGRKSSFVRTPKFNIRKLTDKIRKSKYRSARISPLTVIEGLLAVYFMTAVICGIYIENGSFLIFHILLSIGYATIFFYSVKHLNYR